MNGGPLLEERAKEPGSARRDRQNRCAIDLFAGCGGLTEGLKQAGFKVVGAIELDDTAAKAYQLNHPSVRMWNSDIRGISGAAILSELKFEKGELDLLAGCPPCQGFSTMRTLNGKWTVEDRQNSLLFEFLRLVEELEPRALMMENVPGLAADRDSQNSALVLKSLAIKGNTGFSTRLIFEFHNGDAA